MRLFKKIEYSFGAVAVALSYQAFSAYILFFYVDYIKLPVKLAALGMVIFGFWNAVNDPLFGYISDRTKTRLGRRIPYIALGLVPLALVYFLLWIPPFSSISQVEMLFLYFVCFICLFDGFYTVVVLNWASLYPEMFPSLKERAEVNSYRQTFGMLGLMLGVAVPPLIWSNFGWPVMGAIFAVIIAVSMFIALRGAKEQLIYEEDRPLSLWQALKATFKNRSFLTFAFSNLLIQYSFMLVLACVPFFAKYVLRAQPEETALILFATFFVAIPFMFIWRFVANVFGGKTAYLVAIFVLMLGLIPFWWVSEPSFAFLASGFLGVGLSGIVLLSDIIIADVIDEDEVRTGRRREGMYFGVNALITRLAIGLESATIGGVFMLTAYNPYIYTQSRSFTTGLRSIIAGFPVLALFAAFAIMLTYPLAKDYLKKMQAKLKQLHQKREESSHVR